MYTEIYTCRTTFPRPTSGTATTGRRCVAPPFLSIYIWLYLDAEVLVLPPPVLSSGLYFCWLPIFVVTVCG